MPANNSTVPSGATLRSSMLAVAMLAGLLAGLLTAGYHAVLTEPVIDAAIAIEEASASDVHTADGGHAEEVVSRGTQKIGLWIGWASLGLTWGVMAAAALLLASRLLDFEIGTRARMVAALAGYWVFSGMAAFKYPANPPAVGDPETINERTRLFFGLAGISLIAVLVAVLVAVLLSRRGRPAWLAAIAGVAIVAGAGAVSALLLPTADEPTLVPADLISEFRLHSMIGAAIFWIAFGGLFADWPKLRERLARRGAKARLNTAEAR